MRIMPKVMRPLILAGFTATLLTGCYEYSGQVQDGYIKGAKVCLDLNNNAACDAAEPWAMSHGKLGKYLIKTAQESDMHSVVAYVGADAIDTDNNQPVDAAFTMAAPADHLSIINPLTTLVYATMAADGVDAATAEQQVASTLGVNRILDYDYQASGDEQAHNIAKTVADLLASVQPFIDDSETQNIALRALIALNTEIKHMLEAGRELSSVVVTKGAIYAVNLGDEDNPRNAAAHAGEVEVIAGTGYHNTLFDSADNKCQNCHNDLYDTWQKSMHAQSWVDPIFQSKFQDFLRVHISKIGSSGPSGQYSEQKFKGVAQTCIRCHAPAAFYSGDFDVRLSILSEDPTADYASARDANEANIAPAFDPNKIASVVSVSKNGKVYQASYHIGNKHNREGINCAFCHSTETVRMMNTNDGDQGQYTLARNMAEGPIGPIVRSAGDTLYYNADAQDPDMNAFFRLWGPEKYANPGDTPKDAADFDIGKVADGRYTMKSIPVGKYTGGPFYGPYGVTGVENSRADDGSDRAAQVNPHFVAAGERQHFGDYGKALCLSCHQRSAGAINPESNGLPGKQVGDDQFMELCSTWNAMSDGVGDNYTDSASSPKCQKCHMERVDNKVVLHKWNDPSSLFTVEDGVTEHFDPDSGIGPVAEGYLNNHAFMGANKKDFGDGKIRSGFESSLNAERNGDSIRVQTSLLNKTAHMFPGAHPMRRVLSRVVVTDANGQRLDYTTASGVTQYESIVNQIATLPGESVKPGHETVSVEYNASRVISFPGQTADLDGSEVSSQRFDNSTVSWKAADSTVANLMPVQQADGSWVMQGTAGVNKIVDDSVRNTFTRIYGRETGKKDPANSDTFVVRPGFDSNIARDNRLLPNERESYAISFDASAVTAWPVTVDYRVYYMKKGASGKFPVGADGFLNTSLDPQTLKKLAIYEVFKETQQVH